MVRNALGFGIVVRKSGRGLECTAYTGRLTFHTSKRVYPADLALTSGAFTPAAHTISAASIRCPPSRRTPLLSPRPGAPSCTAQRGTCRRNWPDRSEADLSRAIGSKGWTRDIAPGVVCTSCTQGRSLLMRTQRRRPTRCLCRCFRTGPDRPSLGSLGFQGDHLHLTINSGGKTVNSRLVWRRAEWQ